MDTPRQSDTIAPDRGRKLGVMGGVPCANCGAIVDWRVHKFCQEQLRRFGGRIYCRRCQPMALRGG